ncbi:TetR/AcrR family transcriptional regulator [Streptomyces sp. NPDC048282]|uniref:TetR/AcrR family transcriptional regulator n=1 Tax=Streptomyces sp. NPDC048282 TaxID=3365528 RepID=UPI003721096E
MSETSNAQGRQRPAASYGPARDAARDARIIDATLDLLVEQGYADLTMGEVAVRAGVSKATVYRRWASREDLVADTLESLDFNVPQDDDSTRPTRLRDDLVRTLTGTSGCTGAFGGRLTAVLLATTRSNPEVTSALRKRYVAAQRSGIADCLRRAVARGEADGGRVEELLEPGRLETAAAIALIMHSPLFEEGPLDTAAIGRIVDQVLLPLIAGPRHGA